LRLLQTGNGQDRWNLREIQFYRGDTPIPMPAGTRLEASRNGEDLPYLFDGNLVTGWSPWEFMTPGQYVAMHFSEAVDVDRVVVRSTAAQSSAGMVLEMAGSSGDWQRLAGPAEGTENIAEPDLRKAATAELYRRGYRYLFAMRYEGYVESMQGDPAGWNVERAASGGDWLIFRILPPASAE
jgi:hypothetical protein